VAAVAGFVILAAVPGADARDAKKAPTLSPINATFLLAQLDLARAALRKAIIAAARAAKLNTLLLTPARIQSATQAGSLPKSVLAQLAKLHAGTAGVADFTAALKAGPTPTAPVSLLAGLADGRVTAAEKKEAAALRAYAASVGVH
jgi:hypothetical protein